MYNLKTNWFRKRMYDHTSLAACDRLQRQHGERFFFKIKTKAKAISLITDRPAGHVLDNQVRVSTPENISFQYEITGPFRRLMAYLADVIITLVAFFILFLFAMLLIWAFSVFFALGGGAVAGILGDMAIGILSAIAFLSLWFYGAYMETYFDGRTLGKMLANIRTISVDGSAIDGSQATLRNFFRGLDVAPFLSLGLVFGPEAGQMPAIPIFAFGLLCMTVSPKFQRIGDLVAGTIVVTEEKKWTQGLAKFQDPRVAQLAELIPGKFCCRAWTCQSTGRIRRSATRPSTTASRRSRKPPWQSTFTHVWLAEKHRHRSVVVLLVLQNFH